MAQLKNRFYVGYKDNKLVPIITKSVPIAETHGHLGPIIGPFRSKMGMEFFVKYGYNNPHCQTVHEAEMIVRGFMWDLALMKWVKRSVA